MRIIKRDKNEEEIAEIFGIYWDEERNQTLFLGMTDIFHWALIEKDLLDEVIDGNLELRKKFLDILRSENVIDW